MDEDKVPHYFGPNPNWANSPFTLADAIVTIDPPAGVGRTATATATVGGNGAITGINVIDPGSGYAAAPIVTITGGGLDATATAGAPSTTGSVTSVSVALPGGGYSTPAVDITGDGAGATATAYGSVDVLTLKNAGSGYTMPTLEFELPDDPDGVQATGYVVCVGDPVGGPYCNSVAPATTVDIDHVVLVEPGSGYAFAPKVSILDGTRADPIRPGGSGAEVSATIEITAVKLDTFGTGYTTANATIADTYGGTGAGAAASATVETGAITAITVGNPGSGYVTGGGVRKFIDPLPGLCDPSVAGSCPNWAGGSTTKAIPLAVADPAWTDGTNTHTEADTYVIGLVQYYSTYSSDLPPALTRGYVQIETAANAAISQHFPLVNEMLTGPPQPVMLNGSQAYAVTPPQYLGPIISATKDKPVRIVFHNLLPTGSDGDLFLPVDTTIMGSGPGPVDQPVTQDNGTVLDDARNPHCGESKTNCFSDNRATLHLHGGITPWISDGTPHQWITPAGENSQFPQGVSVENVPDMNVCQADDDGCQTFYYTNQQSARFMFYHDHAWGINRMTVLFGVMGAARRCLDIALAHATTRQQFGVPLAAKQLVQTMLADMAERVALGEMACLHLAQRWEEGPLPRFDVSLAKRSNCAAALEVARMARSVLGAQGIDMEQHIMRHMLNLEASYSYGGTHEIHGLVIGKELTQESAF